MSCQSKKTELVGGSCCDALASLSGRRHQPPRPPPHHCCHSDQSSLCLLGVDFIALPSLPRSGRSQLHHCHFVVAALLFLSSQSVPYSLLVLSPRGHAVTVVFVALLLLLWPLSPPCGDVVYWESVVQIGTCYSSR